MQIDCESEAGTGKEDGALQSFRLAGTYGTWRAHTASKLSLVLPKHSPRSVMTHSTSRPKFRLFAATCALALVLVHPASAQRGPRPEPGALMIKNVVFDSVRIEIRVGPSTNCETNSLVGVRTLRRGRTWAVRSDRGVCWRREQSPGSSATNAWTNWTRRVVPSRAEVVVTP